MNTNLASLAIPIFKLLVCLHERVSGVTMASGRAPRSACGWMVPPLVVVFLTVSAILLDGDKGGDSTARQTLIKFTAALDCSPVAILHANCSGSLGIQVLPSGPIWYDFCSSGRDIHSSERRGEGGGGCPSYKLNDDNDCCSPTDSLRWPSCQVSPSWY